MANLEHYNMTKEQFTYAPPLSAKKKVSADEALYYIYGQKISLCSNNDIKLEGKHPLAVIVKVKSLLKIGLEYKTSFHTDENEIEHKFASDCYISASKTKCIDTLRKAVNGEIKTSEAEKAYYEKRESYIARTQELKDNPQEESLNAVNHIKKKDITPALSIEDLPEMLLNKIKGEAFNTVHSFVNKAPTTAFASTSKAFTSKDAELLNKFVSTSGKIAKAGNGGLIVYGNGAIKKLHDELNISVSGAAGYVVQIESVTAAHKVTGLNLKQ